ncbi:MAG: FtsX-like permease family protein [Bdellovibrionia bacterium]
MSQLFVIAVRNLIQHRKRTFLLGGAISGVTGLLVLLLCLSTGIRETMLESATTLMTGHINVGGFYKVTAGQSAPVVTEYKKVLEIVKRTLPDIDYIAPRGRGWSRLVSSNASMQVGIGGINIEKEPRFKEVVRMIEGKVDDLAQPNTILLFELQAKKLGVHVGDTLTFSALTPRGVSNTIDVRVIGVAQDIGLLSSFNVFIPESSLRELNQINEDTTGALLIYLKDLRKAPEDIAKVRKALGDAGYRLMDSEAKAFFFKFESVNREEWTGQKIDLTTWDEEISFFKWTLTAIEGLMYVLTVILLIIISIGIMNSMWIAIRERTREIGTLRAIGMQRTRVLVMFLIEAFTLGTSGTVLGAGIGILLALLLNVAQIHLPMGAQYILLSSTLKFAVDPSRILTGMLVITGCTTLISVIPSTQAARLKPITAMQHIG